MSNEITKDLRCVLIRGNIEIWLEHERCEYLEQILKALGGKQTFIKVDDQLVNTFEIAGIFTPNQMQDRSRRMNGQWKCEDNRWHNRYEKCECWLSNRSPNITQQRLKKEHDQR